MEVKFEADIKTGIHKEFAVPVSRKVAYHKFVNKLNAWWPAEYTWSKDVLQEIKIEDGHCIEIGPFDFRCDWGRVLEVKPGEMIHFKWQINFDRTPEPNPVKSSDVRIWFLEHEESKTILRLEHFNFENHQEQSEVYKNAMNAELGWSYIIKKFIDYCKQNPL